MTDEQRAILAATAKVAEWIGWSATAIKDRQGWDDDLERLREEARAAIAVLSDAAIRREEG